MSHTSPAVSPTPAASSDSYQRAVQHLLSQQKPDGGWEGEMVWNSMILSQYIIVQKAVGRTIPQDSARQMIRHYEVTRTPDGVWGMHGESEGYVFFTALAYVALRILGVPKDDPLVATARAWLHRQPDGVLAIPTWGKLWLSMCDLYSYEGVNPFPPELFILPEWLPIQPVHFYCHTRYIYMALAYLYGKRFVLDLGPLRDELRAELYPKPYSSLPFARFRHEVARTDLYVQPSPVLRAGYDLLYAYEKRPIRPLRQRALAFCFDRILFEQRASRYQGLSPVNALLNILALYSHSPHHPDLQPSLDGVEAWKWQDEHEGIRYCGARSNTWDTAFAVQALTCGPLSAQTSPPVTKSLQAAYQHLTSLQLQTELAGHQHEHRDAILGGFCFSDGQHRWPVSDCTAEAMTALFALHGPVRPQDPSHLAPSPIPESEQLPWARFEQAVRFLLQRRNADGGFGTYESRRAAAFLEQVNPSEMYGSCMTERSYLECTSSSVKALCYLRARYGHRLGSALSQAVNNAIDDGLALLRRAQRPDGSFPGFWGINFTYAIFHIVEAFRAAGIPASDPTLSRAAAWLVSKQKPDGGWGEHYSSCLNDTYKEHPQTQVVMTSWALLSLLETRPVTDPAITRGIEWLTSMQLPDGSFPQQAQNGVFFGTAMLDYRLYKTYFPVWALGKYLANRAATS